jgi:hypothetical protein
MPDTPAGNVPSSALNVKGAVEIEGVDETQCKAMNKVIRGFIAGSCGKAVSDVAVDDCSSTDGASGASGPAPPRRRLLSAGQSVKVLFTVAAASPEEAAKIGADLKKADMDKLTDKLKAAGFDEVTDARLADLKIPSHPVAAIGPPTSTTTAKPAAPAGPKSGMAFGIAYTWPVIDDAEIDKQAEIVAEWSVRAEYRIEQEKNATAAVIGTRQQVIDYASSAHSLTGDAIDAKNEPGEEVIRHLEKSQDDTVLAKEARRRLKVLKDYRKAVSAKRKVATTKRDMAIAELLRLKVLRINTAKQLWMTLKNKVVELTELLAKRLLVASKDAEAAKKSEMEREPKGVVIAKLDASERAQAAARHVKVYMNAVEYKAKCAHQLLEEWQCKVQINCTVVDASSAAEDRPMWSTPTLDALADTMNEAIAGYKEAKESIPAVPAKKGPAPLTPTEKRVLKLEKKYGTGEFAAGMQGGSCKLEGNRVGHFVKGECVPFEEEKKVDVKDVAKDVAALAGGDGSAGEKAAGAAGKHPADGEGKSDKTDLGAIEARIQKLEGELKL